MNPVNIEILLKRQLTTSTGDILRLLKYPDNAQNRIDVGRYLSSAGWQRKHRQVGGKRTNVYVYTPTSPPSIYDARKQVEDAAYRAKLCQGPEWDRMLAHGYDRWEDHRAYHYWAQRVHQSGWWYYNYRWNEKLLRSVVARAAADIADYPSVTSQRMYIQIEGSRAGKWEIGPKKSFSLDKAMSELGYRFDFHNRVYTPPPALIPLDTRYTRSLHVTVPEGWCEAFMGTFDRRSRYDDLGHVYVETDDQGTLYLETDEVHYPERYEQVKQIVNSCLTAAKNGRT